MRLLRRLDGILHYRYQNQPDRIAVWERARNITWLTLPAVPAARRTPAVLERKEGAAP
jgi:hypothetical protein